MNKRGVALIIAILVILVLGVLGAAFTASIATQGRIAQKYASSTQAFWLADAGIQKALWELNHNACAGFVQCQTATACATCSNCGNASKCIAGTLGANGDYDVTVDNANTTATSVGSYPSRTSTKKATRTVRLILQNNTIFGNAAFAQGSLSLGNTSFTDSYNSTLGVYGGANIGASGSVGSDGTSAGIISISNNATVNGNASTGPGGTVSLGGGATITGTTTHSNTGTLAAVVVPSELTSLTTSGNITLDNGGSTTLNAGDYKYTSISLSNGSSLNVSGNVRLYVTGASSLTAINNVQINVTPGSSLTMYVDGVVTIKNNSVINNMTQTPSDFQLYSTYTGANGIDLNNNMNLYGALYAPTTDISMGNNGALYGAVVGKTVAISNNDAIHYDVALSNIAMGNSDPYIASGWQEL